MFVCDWYFCIAKRVLNTLSVFSRWRIKHGKYFLIMEDIKIFLIELLGLFWLWGLIREYIWLQRALYGHAVVFLFFSPNSTNLIKPNAYSMMSALSGTGQACVEWKCLSFISTNWLKPNFWQERMAATSFLTQNIFGKMSKLFHGNTFDILPMKNSALFV